MMSEKRKCFWSHGCWATMHSTWLVPSAVSVSFPPFQQVVRQGVSVQIIFIGDWPGRGNVYFLNWLATFPINGADPVEFQRTFGVQMGMDQSLGQRRLLPVGDGRENGKGKSLNDLRIPERGARQTFHPGHAEIRKLMLMNSRFSQALHPQQTNFQAARLVRIGAANISATKIMGDRRSLLRELTGQGFDGPLRHSALARSPLGSLRNAVFLSHDIVGELVEAHDVSGHILLVVSSLLDPEIGYG